MRNTTIMVQGATSDAGKSVFVTGLCRVFARRKLSVAPFKPQNMALNSAVTMDGGEIGRAQAVQAQACYLDTHTDMNPILLKPNTDSHAQIIIHGRAVSTLNARDYHEYKTVAMKAVLDSYQRLCEKYHYILVEGAGSPAEINLRDRDIANMGFAESVDCPVILIADISRGGVFAHLIGTLALLSQSEKDRVAGFVINRFCGDIALLQPGLDWLEKRTNKPVFCVLPDLKGFYLEAEDAIANQQIKNITDNNIKVIAPIFPRISNHTDLDPLRLHPQVDFSFIGPGEAIPAADLIILPGTKNVRDDLVWLRENDWLPRIQHHLRYGGKVLGICGGFQMLGNTLADPDGLEGKPGKSDGLGIFSMHTVLKPHKKLKRVSGRLAHADVVVSGYEIHAGVSTGKALRHPAMILADKAEGAISTDNQVMGTYLHGLFDESSACTAILQWAGLGQVKTVDYSALKERQITRLADSLEECLDVDAMLEKLSSKECGNNNQTHTFNTFNQGSDGVSGKSTDSF